MTDAEKDNLTNDLSVDQNAEPSDRVIIDETPDATHPPKAVKDRLSFWSLELAIHIVCLAIYLVPVLLPSEHKRGDPVLDELHILSPENHDVNGNSDLSTIFGNDYWGRPMTSESSHKSWRPLTVLSFRYLKGGMLFHDLTSHRVVNILAHGLLADLVGWLAVYLIPTASDPTILRWMAKLLAALHPTHVEVTANAANRPHLLAVMCSLLLCDPKLNFGLYLILTITGYLCSETFVFQVLPAAVTLMVIVYQRLRVYYPDSPGKLLMKVLQTGGMRFLLALFSGLAYYGCRYALDTLSIPDGLIRPAENPFYDLAGWDRVRNYSYVLSIHIAKAWDIDFIGFSHEYGRACLTVIQDNDDPRLWIPIVLAGAHLLVGLVLVLRQDWSKPINQSLLLYLTYLAWMMTLFPVAGIIKVGTFIADRIVVASSIMVSVLVAYAGTSWLLLEQQEVDEDADNDNDDEAEEQNKLKGASLLFLSKSLVLHRKLLVVEVLLVLMIYRIHGRATQWMDSYTLLQSSLDTCPRFAKAHLEISKIYSGLYADMFNLTQARWHLEQAEAIDPDYCDVHQQFAHVAIQEHGYTEFEDRLTNSLLCPFTMGGQVQLFQRYWKMALDPAQSKISSPETVADAQRRYRKHMDVLEKAMAESEKKESSTTRSSSPLAQWSNGGA